MKTNIIDYIVKNTALKQKDIAAKLNVSRAQISKWKAGESIPFEREEALNKLAGLYGWNTDWAILSKTEENGQAWFEYLAFMGEGDNRHLIHEAECYVPQLLLLLEELGASIPKQAPLVEDVEKEEYKLTSFDSMIWELTEYYEPLVTWCEYYLLNDIDLNNDSDEYLDLRWELEEFSQVIALQHVDRKQLTSVGIDLEAFDKFFIKTNNDIKRKIGELCKVMNKEGIPFATDYFEYLNCDPKDLGDRINFNELFGDSAESVDDLLPYGERRILEETKATKTLLEELHIKIDTLLSEKDKKMLDKELEHTSPLRRIRNK
ncbi:MAG: helix-turn-helix transcriptional regulator [Nitrospinaceae bacterium]|nr:helix-turn-helix transcriptional regulator [Nitrospinaceae bacterium]